ncbi:MAG: SDR family NAD(P)-dependent oxidoreductase [Sphingomonadales bacterium]|nr:SDR family NAD(P)-dependent oxidoreductase [Sphingomonadales bacterium]
MNIPPDLARTHGPVALVTGASSGIGAAFAEELAALGFDLAVAARRGDRLAALGARLAAAHGTQVTPITVDLARIEAPRELLAATSALDIGLVVSNAGFGLKGPHAANDAAAMTDMLMVNCHVPLQLAHGFIPRLRARRAAGRGAGFIMTASVEGLIGCPYSAAYSASKAHVIALGEALWGELSPEGIDVLTLCPGATESEAAAKQGVDPALLTHQLPARDVVRATLAHLGEGPGFIGSDHYRALFEAMLARPRREALRAMAAAMKPGV